MVRYLGGAVMVRLADEGARIALVLLALNQTHSAGDGGLLVAALLVPHVVAAPAVGWLTDRARRPRFVLVAAALGFAAGLTAVAFTLGRFPLHVPLAVLLLSGCCGPALTGGLTSQLADLVPAERLPRAFGADSLTYNVAGVAGPAVAGTVAATWSPLAATVTLAAIAAAGAAVLAATPFRRRSPTADRAASPPWTAGVRAIAKDRVLRTVTVASGVGQLGPGALGVVAAVLASTHGQPSAAGWLLAAVAGGGLLGSLWWTWRPAAPARAPRTAMLALLAIGAPLALASACTAQLVVTAGLFALSGVFLGPFIGALFTTRRDHAPVDAQAQVFTVSAGLKTTSAAAGAAVGGALAGLPAVVLLLLVAVAPLLAGAMGAYALARIRTVGHRRHPLFILGG